MNFLFYHVGRVGITGVYSIRIAPLTLPTTALLFLRRKMYDRNRLGMNSQGAGLEIQSVRINRIECKGFYKEASLSNVDGTHLRRG
jgi:hypothetical protein